jgi:hypothetical protein
MSGIAIYGTHLALCLLTVGLCSKASWWRRKPGLCWAACSVLGAASVLFILTVSEPPRWCCDFLKAYYPAGRVVLKNPDALYEINKPELGFVNLPIVALGLAPISLMGPVRARFVFSLLGVVAIVLAWRLMIRLTNCTGRSRALLVGAFVLSGPLAYSFREGNLTHFVLLLLVAAAWCIETRRDGWLGALLAVAGIIKLPLFLLLAYYIGRRRRRVVAGGLLTLLGITSASLLYAGLPAHRLWVEETILPFLGKPLAAYNVQSVSGFLARLLSDQELAQWYPFEAPAGFKWLHYAGVGVLSGGLLWTFYRSGAPRTPESEHTEFCSVLCLALLISPISWTHYYLLLLLPVGLYLTGRLTLPAGGTAALAAAILLLGPPVISFSGTDEQLLRLFVSHFFVGGVVLLGVLLVSRRAAAADSAEPLRARDPASWRRMVRAPWESATRTTAAYLLLALLVTGLWTFSARTEVHSQRLDIVTPTGERYSSRYNSLVNLAAGRAVEPFVKRRLLVDLARGLSAAIPQRAWVAFREALSGEGRLAEGMSRLLGWLGWAPKDYPLLVSAHLLIYASVVGFLFACRWLTLLLYECPRWLAGLAGAALGVALLGGLGGRHFCAYPYDLPQAFLFTLALASLIARRWWFLPLFALACYSKETSVLLIAACFLLAPDWRSRRLGGQLAVLTALFLGIRCWIDLHYSTWKEPFWFPRRNLFVLAMSSFYLWLAPFLVVGLVRFASAWRSYPLALRKLCLLVVPLVGMAFFKGWIEELRQYLELLPIFGLLVFQWLVREIGAERLLRPREFLVPVEQPLEFKEAA